MLKTISGQGDYVAGRANSMNNQAAFLEQNRFAVVKPELNGIIGTRTISVYHADVPTPLKLDGSYEF